MKTVIQLVSKALFASPFLLLLVIPGCGGSSDGGPQGPSAVELAKVVFVGSSPSDPTPDPGELLVLYFNGQVDLITNVVLDSDDLELSSGSLGSPLSAPTLLNSSAVQITLATGVSFSPGTDTVRLKEEQDAVIDKVGRRIGASTALTILTSDGDAPTIDSLTFNSVPTELNGTGPAGGTLQVPTTGFTIEATYSDPSSPVDPDSLVITSNLEVRNSGVSVAPGTNLEPLLSGTKTNLSASLTVPSNIEFSTGDQILSVVVSDATGSVSAVKTFNFRVRALNDALRPFESTQVWWIDLTRDIEDLSSSTSNGGATIDLSVTPGAADGADFEELLLILGLWTPSPLANVSAGKNSNEVVMDLLKAETLVQLGLLFPSVDISYTFNKPGNFPSGQLRVPYGSTTFSQMAVAGSSDLGALGLAFFDPHNAFHDDDTAVPPATSSRLGVFPYTLASGAINLPGSFFRNTFDTFIDHRGLPIGEDDPGDRTRLQNLVAGSSGGDGREQAMSTAINRYARLLAVVVAHETGHSMGLVQDGAQPLGLYGNDPTNFPGSNSGHIDMSSTAIFPPGAQEVMAPAISFQLSNNSNTGFNLLTLGYLRERVVYDNN